MIRRRTEDNEPTSKWVLPIIATLLGLAMNFFFGYQNILQNRENLKQKKEYDNLSQQFNAGTLILANKAQALEERKQEYFERTQASQEERDRIKRGQDIDHQLKLQLDENSDLYWDLQFLSQKTPEGKAKYKSMEARHNNGVTEENRLKALLTEIRLSQPDPE